MTLKSQEYHIVKNSKQNKKHNYVNWEKYTKKEDVGYAHTNKRHPKNKLHIHF